MALIKVHDKSFGPYLSEQTIQDRIKEMAKLINADYAGKRPLFVAILNGSFMFASDLFNTWILRQRYVSLNLLPIKA